MPDLYHINLDTGDVAMIPPSHVSAATHKEITMLLQELEGGKYAAIAGRPWWRVNMATARGQWFSAQVEFKDARNNWLPLAWLGGAAQSEYGAELWVTIRKNTPFNTNLGEQPNTPWLATRLIVGVDLLSEKEKDIQWLTDFSECLAWVWLLEDRA